MNATMKFFAKIIFMSRWLQAPLYFGLILALGVYVYQFWSAIIGLIHNLTKLSETDVMMGVLDLIDVVMIANLLIMVIIGGYDIFVSRLGIRKENSKLEWLDELNAGTMKTKLALALVSISSIHLLRSFFDVNKMTRDTLLWQVIIHVTLLISVLAIAYTNKLIDMGHLIKAQKAEIR